MSSAGALGRVVRRAAAARGSRQSCELCARPIPDDHRHLLRPRHGELLCACYACSVLFQREGAGQGNYRLVPDRRVRLTGVSPAVLGVPVGLAFFIRKADGHVTAHYPSPAGATRWEVDPARWETVVTECAALTDLDTEVEALLVETAHGRSEAWLVPIDDCYRLVAIVRRYWRGMSGGELVWPEIERFFDELRRGHGTDPDR